MQAIPHKIEGWDLVCKEMQHEHRERYRDNPRIFNQVQRRGKVHYLKMAQQSEGPTHRIYIQSCGKTGSDDE